MEDKKLFKKKLYPIPIILRDEVDKQCEELLSEGIIEKSNSPFQHPVVMIKKADSTYRMAIDYRAINSLTMIDSFPLPRINELLFTVGRAKFISSFDCSSGFYQIAMDPESKEYTAFCTHSNQFQFTGMSFGLVNTTESYQRVNPSAPAPALFSQLLQTAALPAAHRSAVWTTAAAEHQQL